MKKPWAWLLLGAALLAAFACGSPSRQRPGPEASDPENSEEKPATDPEQEGPPFFQDVTASSGIDFTYRNGEDIQPPHLAILESLGGGIALIDYDGDGRLDVFLPGGGYYDGPDHKQIKGHPCKLYRNLGNFRFEDVTDKVLKLKGPWFYSHGCAVADYDRDGHPDLLLTGWGRVALFHNEKDPRDPTKRILRDVTREVGLDKGITWATSAAFADLDGDGFPDLYLCQYVDWSFANHPRCSYDDKIPDVCPPKRFKGLPHKLYRNQGGRSFADASAEAGLRGGGADISKGLGVLAVDINLDGKPELYVANDTVDKFLYVNRSVPGKIRLSEQAMAAGVARDHNGSPNGSMGIDAGDPEGTGWPALWVTNYENELHGLYRNMRRKGAEDVYFLFQTPAAGIGAIGQQFVGWGTGFLDVDHHGWEDLFIANGHAIRYPAKSSRRQRPVLLRNRGGKFIDVSRRAGDYFQKQHLGRGVALGDLDNDGKVDLIISHMNEPVTILRNVSPSPLPLSPEGRGEASLPPLSPEGRGVGVRGGHHWLGVELRGKDNGDVVGARVAVEAGGRAQWRFAKGGGSYASAGDRRHVIGLGQTATVDRLTVIWPDGRRQEWKGLRPDCYYRLTQGQDRPQPQPQVEADPPGGTTEGMRR